MFGGAMTEYTHAAYRVRLQELLNVPPGASQHDINQLIEVGFTVATLDTLCANGAFSQSERDQIAPLRNLDATLVRDGRLTVEESEYLFRIAHIFAMAESIFACGDKAKRWLFSSKQRFSGESPIAMVSTVPGTRQVEELLIQGAEGFVL
jgi:putative toxin-antitoxin system antitoxin component (TIGR02293 family)